MLGEDVRDVLNEVSGVAGSLGGGVIVEGPRHNLEILALFDRCRSIFRAVWLLLERGFAHEAVMLTRPLFTESLMLAEFADAGDTQRLELVIGWSLASLADLEGIYLEGKARGDDVTDELRKIADRRAQHHAYARRHNATARHWRPTEKQLADKHGRGDELAGFRLAHHFVHGSTMAASQRYSKVAEDTAIVGGPAAELEVWERDAGLFAAYSLLHACRAACRIFQWAEPPSLDELGQRVDGMFGASE